MYIVEGLEGGMVAGVTKVHHAAIDGLSGAEITAVAQSKNPDPNNTYSFGDTKVSGILPCASLGFNIFVY